jgi:hypothetical protein
MGQELISKKTRQEFQEYLVGWVLREIRGVFDAADIACNELHRPSAGGQRRSLVEQYYASLDITSPRDVAKLLRAYEYVLHKAFEPTTNFRTGISESDEEKAQKLVGWLRKDGYDYADGRIIPATGMSRAQDLRSAAQELDAPHLADTIRRLEASVDADPALAIGSAKELVETCCKTVLAELGMAEGADKLDLGPLVKKATKALGLVPEDVPEAARGAESIRRVLANLAAVTQGLAEIRNLYGTGHGRDGKSRGLEPRHARLAVGAATTIVTFLFDTHRRHKEK